jgi:hypothetical protein
MIRRQFLTGFLGSIAAIPVATNSEASGIGLIAFRGRSGETVYLPVDCTGCPPGKGYEHLFNPDGTPAPKVDCIPHPEPRPKNKPAPWGDWGERLLCTPRTPR